MTTTTLNVSLLKKEEGNKFFSSKDFGNAIKSYNEGLVNLKPLNKEASELMVALYSNRAACQLSLKEWESTIQDCSSALEIDPNHEKSIYRRAQAYEGQERFDEAFKAMKDLVRRNPKNKVWVIAARRCKERLESGMSSTVPIVAVIEALRNKTGDVSQNLKAFISYTQEDEGASISAFKNGAFDLLWEMRNTSQNELALRAISALCFHPKVVDLVKPDMMQWSDLISIIEGPPETALMGVLLATNLTTTASADVEEFAAVEAWSSALLHKGENVRSAGMDGVVKWCSQAPRVVMKVSDDAPMSEKRKAAEVEKEWKATLSARAISLCKSPANNAIFLLLDSEAFGERQKSLATFGHVMGAVGSEDELKALLEPLLQLGTRDLAFLRRKVALTSALFLANPQVGVWLLSKDGAVHECLTLIASGDDIGQALAAETLCLAASNDGGRSLLSPVVESGTLDALLDSPNARARSAAASTLAKLGVASRALTSDSAETGRLLNTAMLLLKGADETVIKKDSTSAEVKFAESSTVTTERAVEVLAALVTKSAVKDEICHGSGRCAQALSRLCAVSKDGRGASAYGLAHIFSALSVTNKEVQERILAEKEMEISAEQLAELQRITKQKGESEDDTDDAEKCNWRIRQIVQADGIRALVRLADGASENTKELIALALRQIAVEPSVRGSIIQQGGYKLCLNFTSDTASSFKCNKEATWAMAKTLVTTNPTVLTAPQRMGCIAALLRLCKDHRANDLTHFEALMALTNIASFADDTKARIVSEKGIRTLEYMQFSDHPLVRRAATECLTNMMPNQALIEHLRDPEKLKLWCAFAEDFESDLLTSSAAAGTLAMAANINDDLLQETLAQSRICEVFIDLMRCGEPQLTHRAVLGTYYLMSDQTMMQKFIDLKAKGALVKLAKKKNPEWAQIASIAHDAVEMLIRFTTQTPQIAEEQTTSAPEVVKKK